MRQSVGSSESSARSRRQPTGEKARRGEDLVCLRPTDVIFDLNASTKEGVLREIARVVAARHDLAMADVCAGLGERERLGSTALGQGVAIPHARVKGLDRPIVVFVRMRFPISFEAPDGKPVGSMLVLLVPQLATDMHLALLAQGAEMFCDPSFRDVLRTCSDADAIASAFARWPAH